MADVVFNQRFSPAEATRGSWAPIDSSTISNYPTGDSEGVSRGRYAQLNYIVGSEPGALSLALSGGTVILPVSSVNIDEPLQVENIPGQNFVVTPNYQNTTVYSSVTIPACSIATINFSPNATLVELFNNDSSLSVYVGFNSTTLATLSANALPLLGESYYSIERTTSALYIGNANPANSIDVRVIGHRKA